MTMAWRRWATALVLVAAVLYAGWLVHQQLTPPAAAGHPTSVHAAVGPFPGDRAPNFTLRTLRGKTVSLAALAGKPVWINFWATWCHNCRQELALLEQEQARYGGRVVIVGIDLEQSASVVGPFAKAHGVNYPIALDSHGAVAALYGVRGLPTSVFIAPNGTVKAVLEGAMPSAQAARQYLKQIGV